jgi:hypothetical protein
MLTIVGNGPSRLKYDLNKLDRWWGCNAIYRDYTPDLLFAADIPMQNEIVYDVKYYHKNKMFWAGLELLDMDMWDMIKFGFQDSHDSIKELRHPEDDKFLVQGNGKEVSLLGICSDRINNIVIYEKKILRNLLTGMLALGYALESGEKEVLLLGLDCLQDEYMTPDNIYVGTGGNYNNKYDETDLVFTSQKSQFIALLKHYSDSKVYFKNPLDELYEVKYNELSYYESSKEWVLGQGFDDASF